MRMEKDYVQIPEGLDIKEYDGEGYNRTHTYGSWRVAFLNYAERFDRTAYMERHLLTDEVFVLLCGDAELLIGREMTRVSMKKNKIYNIRAGVWHNIRVSRDAKVLVVENSETAKENSEYFDV